MAPEHALPVATASLPWQIVLAIIAFNIIAGIMSKRNQRPKKPDPAKGSQGGAEGDARRRMEEARARAAAEAERKAAEREARRAREESRGSARSGAEDQEGAATATVAQDAAAKAKEAGRDLLGQLARELGLELPQAPKPGQPGRPAPGSRSPQASRSASQSVPARSGAGPAARRAAEREEEGSTSPVPMPSPVLPAYPEPVRSAGSPLARELADADALRKAFILKTVLDKPLALRPRRLA